MPAYAYPIKVNRRRQTIQFDETKRIESDSLILEDFKFVGDDAFSISLPDDWGGFNSGYIISVSRSRLETIEERNNRIAKEESYMVEYNKRHTK